MIPTEAARTRAIPLWVILQRAVQTETVQTETPIPGHLTIQDLAVRETEAARQDMRLRQAEAQAQVQVQAAWVPARARTEQPAQAQAAPNRIPAGHQIQVQGVMITAVPQAAAEQALARADMAQARAVMVRAAALEQDQVQEWELAREQELVPE